MRISNNEIVKNKIYEIFGEKKYKINLYILLDKSLLNYY